MLAYDAYGNLTSETDPRSCTTTTSYESSQTYPAASTSCLSHTTNLQYDARWGRLTQRTDPNGQATTYSYDVFGRLTRITGPLDTASLYGSASYEYVGLGDPASQRIVARRTTQHGTATHRWSEAYFDGLGRIYLTRAQAPAGQVIATDATFDVRGLVSARSTPHLTTEAAVWTQFSYDPLRRQTQILHADG